tara:strand:+ start:21 stop:233 length:213 start_codon:yes stop_codon:yes gene_type:complete
MIGVVIIELTKTNLGAAMKSKPGLYANINAKQKRIAAGSGEKMNKVGSKAAPSAADFKLAAKTAKKKPKK